MTEQQNVEEWILGMDTPRVFQYDLPFFSAPHRVYYSPTHYTKKSSFIILGANRRQNVLYIPLRENISGHRFLIWRNNLSFLSQNLK